MTIRVDRHLCINTVLNHPKGEQRSLALRDRLMLHSMGGRFYKDFTAARYFPPKYSVYNYITLKLIFSSQFVSIFSALFILVGVFIFLGCSSSLNKNLKGDGSVQYPFGLCILAGLICVAASVVSGYGLKTHLLHWDDEDEALDDGTMEAE